LDALVWLACGWLAYAALHSALAALVIKRRLAHHLPGFAPYYRLAYNGLATILLLPLLWATWALPGEWLWRWTGGWAWLANGLALAALAGFLFSGGSYDMGEFLGLTPLREKRRDAAEHDGFRLSPLHRHVRHPWYFLGLVLIWTRDMNGPLLVSALAITLYFVIGSRLEERKLEAHFGTAYRAYRERVPGLVPLPWKSLPADEAAALVQRTKEDGQKAAAPRGRRQVQ
jgi:protein-S-isoprenylcysteine O-methyltransferase Ste14